MSRTVRNKHPKMELGNLSDHQYSDGKVRDGTPQYISSGCKHHGSCTWCEHNRTYKHRKLELTWDTNTNLVI